MLSAFNALTLISLCLRFFGDPRSPEFPIQADFSPFLFPTLILVLIVCFLSLLLGIFAALVLAGFITAGIISASVMTAVLKRSVSSGFRALFLQIGGVLGLITGAVGAMIFIWLAKIPSDSPLPWIIGLIAGLLWGLLSACLFNFAWRRIVEWIAAKLPRHKTKLPETAEEANADEGNPKVRL